MVKDPVDLHIREQYKQHRHFRNISTFLNIFFILIVLSIFVLICVIIWKVLFYEPKGLDSMRNDIGNILNAINNNGKHIVEYSAHLNDNQNLIIDNLKGMESNIIVEKTVEQNEIFEELKKESNNIRNDIGNILNAINNNGKHIVEYSAHLNDNQNLIIDNLKGMESNIIVEKTVEQNEIFEELKKESNKNNKGNENVIVEKTVEQNEIFEELKKESNKNNKDNENVIVEKTVEQNEIFEELKKESNKNNKDNENVITSYTMFELVPFGEIGYEKVVTGVSYDDSKNKKITAKWCYMKKKHVRIGLKSTTGEELHGQHLVPKDVLQRAKKKCRF